MLQNIRDRATGPVAWFILGLLILLFSLWGIESYFTTAPDPKLAVVGDMEITRAELQRAYDQRYQRLQTLMGENFRHDLIDPKAFRSSVLNEMVQSALLEQYVDRQDYRVGDAQVLNYLKTVPVFQVDGSFSPEAYRATLARESIKPQYYENQIRTSLQIEQLRQGLLESGIVTARDIEAHWRLEQQKRDVAILQFDNTRYVDEIRPTDAQIAARYEQDKGRFLTPERVRLDYIELDRNALPPAGAPEEELLRALYEAEKQARFSRPEQRQARHILIQVDAQTNEAKAQEKAIKLREELSRGADFAALAAQNSGDPDSKVRGGQLDPVTRGVLDPAFEDALFKLKRGETSQPVRSSFGWHIIRLDRIDAELVKPFTDPAVRAEVLGLYREREVDERYRQMAEKMDELSFEHAESLQPIVQALNLKIQSSDWLMRDGGPGIGSVKEVVDVAFSEAMLKDKVNSTPVKAGASRLIVLRVAAHEISRQRPLAEVKEEIMTTLKREAAQQKAQAQSEAALAELRKGTSLDAVAAPLGVSPLRPGLIARQDSSLAPAMVTELFRMPRPVGNKPSYAGIALPEGGYAILVVLAVQDGSTVAMTTEEREAQVQALSGRLAGEEFGAFKRGLEKDIKVKINEDQL